MFDLALTYAPHVLAAIAAIGLVIYLLGFWAMMAHTRRPKNTALGRVDFPPISLLKPLRGTEEALEQNLTALFELEYPAPIEIIFAASEPDDAGLDVARKVAARFPSVPVRFVQSDPDFGYNPKVANLAGALAAAKHDLVFQSDANVRVQGDYLKRIVTEFAEEKASLLTSLVVGRGEKSVGAAMENLQLTAFISPAMCFALKYAKVTCVVGKSMLFRKSELAALGGLESVRDILAEDYILGNRYQAAGKRLVLSRTTADNINIDIPFSRFTARHTRWLQMRAVIHMPAFIADVFANFTVAMTFAVIAAGFEWRWLLAWVALAIVKIAGDGYMLKRIRGEALAMPYALLPPLKDLVLAFVWLKAGFSRRIDWRGTKLKLMKDSRVEPVRGARQRLPHELPAADRSDALVQ